ncbi:hypothetical protein PYW08_014184 [Mythimna loreyi]|uniref:Uncharacterized protein n=1 Tax=Mythimna loreyi TaxID=667449 RepID=A0ACC2R9F7_9NEOP|nr:hypothetical protein PYW08_014184 [Mythimna loreyi]
MVIRLCVVVCAVGFLCVTADSDEESLDVKTAQGVVRGRLQPFEDLYAFYNIPYATAPRGEHKFKAPLPPPKWPDTYESLKKNVVCPQNKAVYKLLPEPLVMDEDCLLANVFVPRTTQKDLSVLVYVHGGAFSIGYGKINRGSQLMKIKKDVIMVTFNYRLGVHGFLCLGTKDIPGNAGMKDQVALLRWVQNNIASFGGNHEDVTLAGSSTGSASVDLLVLSKSAEGLFHKVILESGGSLAAFAVQRDPLQIAKYHASKLNFTNFHDIHTLEDLYKRTSLELLTSDSFFDRPDSTFLFSPCVERNTGDGAFLTESPLTILKKGSYQKLPMLYGFTSMEGLLRIDYFDIWKHKMNDKFSDFLPADLKIPSVEEREEVAKTIKSFYFDNKPVGEHTVLGFINFFTDVLFTYPMLKALQLYAEGGNNQVYLYEYNFLINDSLPYPHVRGPDHCAQSTAWLDNLNYRSESLESKNYQKMRSIVRELWHNFIKTGKPVPEGSSLPTWPPAGMDKSPHMKLGEKVELHGVLLEERTRFWDDIYQKYYRDAVPPPSPGQTIVPIEPMSGTTETIYGFLERNVRLKKE